MMYQAGQRVPEFRGRDGVFLSIDGSGVFLLCRMASPTAQERQAFESGQPIQIGMGVEQGILFWVARFGDIPAMDCTYSPQIARSAPALPEPRPNQGYALTVILADGETGETLKLRLIGLPHDFSVELRNLLAKISASAIDYQKAIAALYRLSTQQLDERATARCILMGG